MILIPALSEFMERYPDIRIEVIATDRRMDLSRAEADVALRATLRVEEPGVVFRRLSGALWGMYCTRAHAAAQGAPRCVEEMRVCFFTRPTPSTSTRWSFG